MRRARRAAQTGVVLVALLAVLALGASWYLVSTLNSNTSNRLALQRAHNAKVLEQAKRALLGWAALNAGDTTDINPGRVPCPEDTATYYNASTEGTAAATCDTGALPAIGRLPWRTLGLPKLLDASGEPLWYVVSKDWKLWPTTTTPMGINSNSAGQLTLGTQTPVALIIAPGPAITISPTAAQSAVGCVARSQNRNFSSPTLPDYRDYLECGNATSPVDAIFVTEVTGNGANPVFNDQLVAVSSAEVMNAIEGPVAKRIKDTVVTKLQETYVTNASQWGATSANPVFPFAATFADPAGSTFKGVVGTSQGLLPMSGSACTGLMATHCDSTFVQWNTAGITVTKNSGTGNISSYTCAASSSTQVSCNITIQQSCGGGLGSILGGVCTLTFDPSVTITATAQNLGKALRTISTASIVNLSGPSLTATLGATGNASTSTTGTINTSDSCNLLIIFSLLFPCTASSTVTVAIPIGVFQDHPLNTAVSTDNWYWFAANRWYDVTYFAVAASHTPSGSHNCTGVSADCLCVSTGDCTVVANGTAPRNIRALITLAGRSLIGTVGTNRPLTDFLETAENNTTIDWKFTSGTANKTFNDRFITLNP